MKKKVCIIGAGAAGLAAIRHVNASNKLSGVVYEMTEDIGGIWNYTDKSISETDSKKPIHSTAYKGLRTNLPKEIMGFLDFPFVKGENSFVYHEHVLEFLRDYADHFSLLESIQFNSRVISISPLFEDSKKNCLISDSASEETDFSENTSLPKWEVKVERIKEDNTNMLTIEIYDAVIICNGHFWKPLIPRIKNLENFKGTIIHSRDYRISEPFTNKSVVVFGCGPSGIDIMLEIAEVASKVTLSMRNPPYPGKLPAKITQTGPISEIMDSQVVFQGGDTTNCEIILLCTGYEYDLPFLSPKCGLKIEQGKLVSPLYRHMTNSKYPTMVLIGLSFRTCPFILFDLQVRHFVKYLEGEVKLPSEEQMLLEIETEAMNRKLAGIPFSRSHQLEELQWPLFQKLGSEAGVSYLEQPKLVVRKIYEKVAERRKNFPEIYKNDQIVLIDDEHFEIIEAPYTDSFNSIFN